MDTTRLKVIASLEDCRSMGQCAQELGMSQPAVSYHVRKAESELGFSLFERRAAGMVPTEQGRMFCQLARQLIDDYCSIVEDAGEIAHNG